MSLSGLFIRTVIAPLWAIKEGTPYLKHLRNLDNSKLRPLHQVQADQWRRFKKLLDHAYTTTDFYRYNFDSARIKPDDIKELADLPRLPLLTKDAIRSNKEAMISSSISRHLLTEKKTSGSTGVSLELFVDNASTQWKRAVTISFDRWAGWDLGERIGAIWGNPLHNINWRSKLRNYLLDRCTYLDTLNMDEVAMMSFYRELKKNSPELLFGHAHSLYLFARFLEVNGLLGIRPRGIISTCMVLHDFERKTIENAFGCRVTNRYGCEEVSLISCECPEGKMHINCDSLIVEFIRDGKSVPFGEPGAIVVTDLTNYGMPFIRYKVGDVAIPSNNTSCPCGCSYPLIDSLEGRVADYVVTPEGNYISGISLTENFAMHLPGVKQMQIVQEKIDLLVFRIVKGALFCEQTVEDIHRLAHERFGSQMKWHVMYVNSIQSEKSGKFRFCISNIKNRFS